MNTSADAAYTGDADMTTFDITDADLDFTAVPDTLDAADDGKRECPDCGRRFTVTQAGTIRQHNCNGTRTVTRNTPKKRGKRDKTVPESVMRVGTAALASGIEWGTSTLVASYVPCERSEVPADIPDANAMVGPLIKGLWPSIPAKAQGLIQSITDHEDMILCLLAWIDYGNKLKAWADTAHKIKLLEAREQEARNGVQEAPTGFGSGRQSHLIALPDGGAPL